MKRFAALFTALIMAAVLFASPALAEEKKQPELKIDKVDVAAYSELVDHKISNTYGVRELLKVDGKILVSVSVVVEPQWTEEIKNARIDAKNIKFVAGGEEILMIGYFERYAQFRVDTDSFSAYRRSNWKEKPQKVHYNAVFAVPEGTAEGELKLGAASIKVTVPKAGPAPDPAKTVKVEVVKASFPKKVISEHSVGKIKPKPVTVLTGGHGLLLELQIKVTPLMGNGDDPNHFFWYTPWFAVLTDDGHYIPTFGEMFMDKVNNNVSHNLNKSSDGDFSTGEADFYFMVPPGIKTYKLIYQGVQVAEGQLEAPAAPAPKEPAPEGKKTEEQKGKDLIKNIMKQN